jgi:hypothetical protein
VSHNPALAKKIFGTKDGKKFLSDLYNSYCDIPLLTGEPMTTGARCGKAELIQSFLRDVYGKNLTNDDNYSTILDSDDEVSE